MKSRANSTLLFPPYNPPDSGGLFFCLRVEQLIIFVFLTILKGLDKDAEKTENQSLFPVEA